MDKELNEIERMVWASAFSQTALEKLYNIGRETYILRPDITRIAMLRADAIVEGYRCHKATL